MKIITGLLSLNNNTMFIKKIEEINADTDLSKYKINLGRKDKEIKDMNSRIEEELLDVLTPNERKKFNLDTALKRINYEMNKIK